MGREGARPRAPDLLYSKRMRLVYWTIFPNGHQRAWIDALRAAGHDVEVCYFGHYDAYRTALGWVEPEALPPQERRARSLAEARAAIPDYDARLIVLTGYAERVYWENVRHCERNGVRWCLVAEKSQGRARSWPLRRAFARHVNRSAWRAFGLGPEAVDDLVREHPEKRVMPKKARLLRRIAVMLLSAGLCWLVAVIAFVLMGIISPSLDGKWLAFVYAVPASAIVVLVFSCIWHYRWVRIAAITLLVWTLLTCVYLTALVCGVDPSVVPIALIYLVGVPLQVLALIFFVPWKRMRLFSSKK